MAQVDGRPGEEYIAFSAMHFDVRREGRRYEGDEFNKTYFSIPEKMEACDGQIYCTDDDRLKVLGALLECMGADAAVGIGDPAVWRAAVAALR